MGARIRRRGRLAALGSAMGVLLTLAVSSPAHAVANGEDVADGRYRFATSLSMPEITRPDGTTYASACSAALIAPQWIISAGHCFHDGARNRVSGPPRYPVLATVGQATLSGDDGTTVEVVHVVQREDADVAIAKLERPVWGVWPLGISHRRPAEGDIVRIVGWGSSDAEADLTHRPDRAQTGQFTVTRIDDTQVYVTGHSPHRDVSACPYDSGAPFFYETRWGYELAATEIGGPECPHTGEEYTARADVLRHWIYRHVY